MSLLCIALHDVSASRDARTFRRTAGSKRGDQTSLRKLKWSERKGQGQTNIALFLSPSSEEFPGAWGSLGSISPSFSSHCNLKKKKMSITLECLTCLPPIWLFIPSEQPFHSLTPCGKWVWGMLRLSSRSRHWTGFVHSCLLFSSCFSIDKTHCTWLGLHD